MSTESTTKIGCDVGGCFGCLGVLLFIWLIFYGGFSRVNELIDTQIAVNKIQLEKARTPVIQPERTPASGSTK